MFYVGTKAPEKPGVLRVSGPIGLYVTKAGQRMAEEGLTREHDVHIRLRELLSDARYEALEQAIWGDRGDLRDAHSA